MRSAAVYASGNLDGWAFALKGVRVRPGDTSQVRHISIGCPAGELGDALNELQLRTVVAALLGVPGQFKGAIEFMDPSDEAEILGLPALA